MNRRRLSGFVMMLLLVAAVGCQPAPEPEPEPAPMPETVVPKFEVDPLWPALPNDWVLGSVASVDVADDGHVWVYHRPRSVDEDQQAPAAPAVLEFESDGTFIQAWGGPGDGYDWPMNEHGIEVDGQGHVWVGGNNADPSDDMLLKFTHEGEFVMQIGGRAQSAGNTDTDNLKRPAEASVYPATNEVFVADGYGNRRVIVFDADSGEFKRMWGAFENEPIEASDEQPPPDEMLGPQQFGTVHGIEVSNDGLVYIADRDLNRIQVFTIDGAYQTQVFINKDANANSVAGLAFSPDPAQFALGPQQFGTVHGIEVSNDGLVYIADRDLNRIQVFTIDGLIRRKCSSTSTCSIAKRWKSSTPSATKAWSLASSAGCTTSPPTARAISIRRRPRKVAERRSWC